MLERGESNPRDRWYAFKVNGDPRARADIIQSYQFLVHATSSRLAARLPSHVEEADLASYGIVGLINAVDRFDPEQNVKFETFASKRIHGAIIDALRSNDWVPRSVRSRMRAIDKVTVVLGGELGRKPTRAEIAAVLEVDEEFVGKTLSDVAFSTIAALDEPSSIHGAGNDEYVTVLETVTDERAADPFELFAEKNKNSRVSRAVGHLPERERAVISLHYFERMTLREIGSRLHVTESRVSQLHTRAIARLKAPLAELIV